MLKKHSFFNIKLQLHRAVEQKLPPQWALDKTDRPYSVFWYVLSGEKEVAIGETTFYVQEGELVIFPSQIPFTILGSAANQPLHIYDLAIECKIGPFDLFHIYNLPTIMKIKDKSDIRRLLELWKNIIIQFNKAEFDAYQAALSTENSVQWLQLNGTIYEWTAELLTLHRPSGIAHVLDPRLYNVILFIHKNISQKITLKRLANEAFLSESHLSLLFKKQMGQSPIEFVRSQRLQKARELLLTTEYSIKEIATLVGFVNQNQFSRTFQKEVGISPSQYRKNSNLI